MAINSIGGASFTAQMQHTNAQQTAAMSSLKGAMKSSEQFLQLLEQSITVKQTQQAAAGLGIIVDITI